MIVHLSSYPSTKASGVSWVGRMPSHWQMIRAKWLFAKMDRPVRHGDEVVTCFRDGTVTLRKNRRELGYTESLKEIGYQGVRRGDLVVHAMDAFAGACGVSDSDGKSTPVYSVCAPKDEKANAHYYAFCIREMARSQWILALSRGVRERSTDFRFAAFADQTVPLPPSAEQTAIVRFLDHADRRIRRYIRAKERLIELLEEQKQAIIYQAVTGQIDVGTGRPYPAYKESGVDWLGRVPEHWQVIALRYRYEQCLGKMLDTQRITGEFLMPYLRNVDVQWDDINVRDLPTMDIHPNEIERYTIRRGDLLVCEGGEVGRCAVWQGETDHCGFQKALHRLRPRNSDVPRFLYFVLRAAVGREAFLDGHESTITHLTGEKLRAHRFPFPPVAEQRTIQVFLDATCAQLEATSDAQRKIIQFLREFRTRLVADVVTGKRDVGDVAAALPAIDSLVAEDTIYATSKREATLSPPSNTSSHDH
ncbi:MAG: restriction endonuclease subunit S [bacterium]|nr:restriction endonuclease subunit S [bacterium]